MNQAPPHQPMSFGARNASNGQVWRRSRLSGSKKKCVTSSTRGSKLPVLLGGKATCPRSESQPTIVQPPKLDQGYERTQPPELLLKALLHSDCTGTLLPFVKVTFAAAPCPEEIQAHLSPFSAPLESSQPVLGNWSVTVSAIS